MPAKSTSSTSPTIAPIAPELVALDDAGRAELDRQLGHWQRRRTLLYFALVTLFMALSTATGTFTWPGSGVDASDSSVAVWRLDNPAVGDFLDTMADLALTTLFFIGLVITLPKHRTHRQVVTTLQVVLVAATAIIVVVAPFAAAPTIATDTSSPQAISTHVALAAAAGIFLLHLFASAMVALSPREALRPLVPMALIFAVVVLAVAPVPWPQRFALAMLGPVAGIPGLIWSVARYRRFQERFVARFLRRRVDDLDRDLQHARRLHESMLPTPIRDGPVRVDYHYEPMLAIGGDFLTLRRNDRGQLIVILVDVTGHGIAAALAVNRLHGEIDRLLAESNDADPGAILAGLNRYACASLSPQGIYATAICVRVDPDAGELEWANAGHPPALLVRSSTSPESLNAGGCMLGVVDGADYDIDVARAVLQSGDRVLLYTDGASEAFDDRGEMFGVEGIIGGSWAQTGGGDDPVRSLAAAIGRFRAGPPRDDLLAVGITYIGNETAPAAD